MVKRIEPIHPGEILLEEFLLPMQISQYRLAKDISVPPRRINEIVHGKRAIAADAALRLARGPGLEPGSAAPKAAVLPLRRPPKRKDL